MVELNITEVDKQAAYQRRLAYMGKHGCYEDSEALAEEIECLKRELRATRQEIEATWAAMGLYIGSVNLPTCARALFKRANDNENAVSELRARMQLAVETLSK